MSSRFPSRVPGTLPLPPPPGDWYVTVESLKSLLRTINGQSLVGQGDIAVSGGGSSITIDPTPAQDSTNAVMSKGVYTALQGKQATLTFDTEPKTGSGNPVTSGAVKSALDALDAAKQDELEFDETPTLGHSNPVTSGGVRAALDLKQNALELDPEPTSGSTKFLTSGTVYTAIADLSYIDNEPRQNSTHPVTSTGLYTAFQGKQDTLTETQLAAVNSGITAALVTAYSAKMDAPSAAGQLGQYLISDGNGGLKWKTVAAGGDANAVHYASDGNRSDSEKTIARNNIGAASADDLTSHTGNSSIHLTTAQAARVAQASRQCSTMPTTSEGIENGEIVLYTGTTTSSFVCGTYYRATTHAAGYVVRPGTDGYPMEGATLYCTENPSVTKTSSVLIQLYTDIDRTEGSEAIYSDEASEGDYNLKLDYFDQDTGTSVVLAYNCPTVGHQSWTANSGTVVTAIPTVEWTAVANWLTAPSGGTAGQVLTKTQAGTAWQDPSAQVTVDSALSTTSENPVQNKVVKAALDGKLGVTDAEGGEKLVTDDVTIGDYFGNTGTLKIGSGSTLELAGGSNLHSDGVYIDLTSSSGENQMVIKSLGDTGEAYIKLNGYNVVTTADLAAKLDAPTAAGAVDQVLKKTATGTVWGDVASGVQEKIASGTAEIRADGTVLRPSAVLSGSLHEGVTFTGAPQTFTPYYDTSFGKWCLHPYGKFEFSYANPASGAEIQNASCSKIYTDSATLTAGNHLFVTNSDEGTPVQLEIGTFTVSQAASGTVVSKFASVAGQSVSVDADGSVDLNSAIRSALSGGTNAILKAGTGVSLTEDVSNGTVTVGTTAPGGYTLTVQSLGPYGYDCAVVLLPSGTMLKPSEMLGHTYSNVTGFVIGGAQSGMWDCSGTGFSEVRYGYVGELDTHFFRLSGDATITYLSGGSCLHPGTLIAMADGTERLVGDVKVGDLVMSLDPVTHARVSDRVTVATGVVGKGRAVRWTFDDGTTVVTVNRHRFYNSSLGEFCYIQAWEDGEAALRCDGSHPRLVSSETLRDSPHATIFTERYNNYFANGLLCGNRKSVPIGERI